MKYTYKTWEDETATTGDCPRRFDKDYKVKIRIKGIIKPFVMKIYKYNNGHNIKLGVEKSTISISRPAKDVENVSFHEAYGLTYAAVQALLDNYLECTRGDRRYVKKLLNSIPASFLRDSNIRKAYEKIIDDLVAPYADKKLSSNKLKSSDGAKIDDAKQSMVKKYLDPRIEIIKKYLLENKPLLVEHEYFSEDDEKNYNEAKEEKESREREEALSRALEERAATEDARRAATISSHRGPVAGE